MVVKALMVPDHSKVPSQDAFSSERFVAINCLSGQKSGSDWAVWKRADFLINSMLIVY